MPPLSDELDWLVEQGHLTADQAARLREALQHRPSAGSAADRPVWKPRFDLLHVAYYFGGLLVMAAMAFFVTLSWEILGGAGIAAIALAYAAAFVLVGRRLWQKHDLVIPGGILITLAVAMMPLATYGVEKACGWWPGVDPGDYHGFHEWVKSGWLAMEVVTALTAAVALRWFRFPFLTAPLAFCLWYISMDAAPLIAGGDAGAWEVRGWVSLGFGAATVAAGGLLEKQWHPDFGLWLYRFGLIAFWAGLLDVGFYQDYPRPWGPGLRLLAGLLGLASSVFGTAQNRLAFSLTGLIGMLVYGNHLVFSDSLPRLWGAVGYGVLIGGTVFAVARQDAAPRQRLAATCAYALSAGLLFLGAGYLTLCRDHAPEWQKALFVPFCVLMLYKGVVLQRRPFVALGAIGLFWYVGHLAFEIFQNSLLFPFVVSGLGLGIIALAVLYRKRADPWRAALLAQLPAWIVERLPAAG